jgi:integrase
LYDLRRKVTNMKNLPGFRYNAKKRRAHFEVIVLGTHGSKRRRKTVEAADAVEATTMYHAFRKVVAEEEKGPAIPRTLRWYFEENWPKLKKSLSPKSQSAMENIVEHRLLPRIGGLLLEKINDAEVADLVGAMKAEGYAPETINGTLAVLRKLLRNAVAREVLPVYPIKGRLPLVKATRLRLELSPEERAAFLSALDDETAFRELVRKENTASRVERIEERRKRGLPTSGLHGGGLRPDGEAAGCLFERFRELRPLFVVALETGLRKGDLLALRWSSVDLKNGWLRVAMGKTQEEALIPLSRLCRAALEECRTRVVGHEFVFVSEGAPRRKAGVRALAPQWRRVPEVRVLRAFETAKKLAGITRRFRFHDLRHTFASTLASQGVSLQVIAKALGHTTTRMSERYARPSEEAIRKAADALDRANQSSAVNSTRELVSANGTGGGAVTAVNP